MSNTESAASGRDERHQVRRPAPQGAASVLRGSLGCRSLGLFLIGLGIDRALVGHRSILRTLVETITIAAAALAGVGIAKAIT